MGMMIPMVVTMVVNLIYTILAVILAVVAIHWMDLKFFTKIDFQEEIKKGNLAAGVLLAAILIFMGIVISSGLSG
ncbi:MAG: uncharacterized membrane protein YjfL (UPF0719 family) [Lysobacterales bacterium]|jgi:uncharacterized membrane protein YjfL (UPF0719 family)